MNGFRLIRVSLNGTFYKSMEFGMVEYRPKTEYRIDKKNAFDPTRLHRRDKYHVDQFSISTPATPAEFQSILNFLRADGTLYIEFHHDNQLRQFPITVSALPTCPDDLHEYTTMMSFTAESRYRDPLSIINFDTVALSDFTHSFITTT